MSAPRDPGLQPERTELSWRRTLLALAAGALVSVRVLPPVLGDWAVVSGIGGVVVAAVLWVASGRRHRRWASVLRGEETRVPGGVLLLLLACFVSAGAALGLVFLLVGRLAL